MAPTYKVIENKGKFSLVQDDQGNFYAQHRNADILNQIYDRDGTSPLKTTNLLWRGTKILAVDRVGDQNLVFFENLSGGGDSRLEVWRWLDKNRFSRNDS